MPRLPRRASAVEETSGRQREKMGFVPSGHLSRQYLHEPAPLSRWFRLKDCATFSSSAAPLTNGDVRNTRPVSSCTSRNLRTRESSAGAPLLRRPTLAVVVVAAVAATVVVV